MEYTLINTDLTCGGIVGTEPTHNNWTLTPYLGGLVKENWNGSAWIEAATPEEIDLARTEAIDKLKKECYDELALTDWYFVRKIDIGIEVPKKIIEQRNEIRKKYNDLINENLS